MERINQSPNAIEVTPSDTVVYQPPLVGLRVGTTAGDVVVMSGGQLVTIPDVQIGETIHMSINKVMATTAAVGLTGFQWSE
jgi:hypothetical protein